MLSVIQYAEMGSPRTVLDLEGSIKFIYNFFHFLGQQQQLGNLDATGHKAKYRLHGNILQFPYLVLNNFINRPSPFITKSRELRSGSVRGDASKPYINIGLHLLEIG